MPEMRGQFDYGEGSNSNAEDAESVQLSEKGPNQIPEMLANIWDQSNAGEF